MSQNARPAFNQQFDSAVDDVAEGSGQLPGFPSARGVEHRRRPQELHFDRQRFHGTHTEKCSQTALARRPRMHFHI